MIAATTLALSNANAQSVPDPLGQAVKDVAGGIANILGTLFNPNATAFREAVKGRRFSDALALYDKNSASFRQDKELESDVQTALMYVRTQYSLEVEAWLAQSEGAIATETYKSDVQKYVAMLSAGREVVKAYLGSAQILKDFQDSDPLLVRVNAQEQQCRLALQSNITAIYRSFPHERIAFRDVVPQADSETALLRSNWDVIGTKIETLNDVQVQAVIKNTATAWSADPQLKAQVTAAIWNRMSPTYDGPLAKIQGISEVEQYGISKADLPVRPRIFVVDSTMGPSDMPMQFTSTYDAKLNAPFDFLASAEGLGDPALLVEIQERIAKRNIVDKAEISSEFKSGTRSVPNANYAIAQMNCQRAQSDLAAQRARNTMAPAAGVLGALVQGVAEGAAIAVAQRACNEFAATPPTIEENVYSSYSYTVTSIEVMRRVRGRIVAMDGLRDGVESYPISSEESEKFKVAYGRKDGDRGSVGDAISDADFEARAARPFAIDVDKVVQALRPTQRVSVPRNDLAALLGHSSAPPNLAAAQSIGSAVTLPAMAGSRGIASVSVQQQQVDAVLLDPRMQSVVVVLNPKGGLGAGFYVDTNVILSNYHVVEGATTIEIRGVDGQLHTGRVVKKDIGIDLALIRVDRPGVPVTFAQTILKPGDSVDAIGHPKGLYFSVSRGIVSAIRQAKGLLAQGGDKALVIQTDAQINPGNSGGPLFLGDRVIGVNTIKFRGADGIGFAIHYSEVIRFLSQQ